MLEAADIDLVAAIAAAGSPGQAARRMGVHPATLYRRLADLQSRVREPLFERAFGRYRPTELGREIALAAHEAERRLAALNRRIAGLDQELSGLVVVTTADSLAAFVAAIVACFAQAHSAVDVKMTVSAGQSDLGRGEADVAIRPTSSPPETLYGRRAGRFDYRAYERAGGAEGWIMLDGEIAAIPAARWLRERVLPEDTSVSTDSMVAAAELCRAGAGRALLPGYLGTGLNAIGEPIAELTSHVWVLTHQDVRHIPRIAAFTSAAAIGLRESIEESSSR